MIVPIIPRIGYQVFVSRAIRQGLSFPGFTRWLTAHPLVRMGSLTEMAEYWSGRERGPAFAGAIRSLDPSEMIPERMSVPALPGRQRQYTYVLAYEATDVQGQPIGTQNIIVQSDRPALTGDVLSQGEAFVLGDPSSYGYAFRDLRIEYMETF
jgi:hypothetical protein